MLTKQDDESILLICSNLKVYLESGLKMIKALELVQFSLTNKVYIESVERIIQQVRRGKQISEAIINEEYLYPDMLADMLIIGEESGNLERVLGKLAINIQRKRDTMKQIRKVMVYPIALTIIIATVFIFYFFFILPSFKSLYESIQGSQSKVIELIISYLNFVEKNQYAYLIIFCYIGIIVAIIALIYEYIKDKDLFRELKIVKMYYEANIIFILELMITSGISLNSCLDMLSNTLESRKMKNYINIIKEELWKGKSLSEALSLIEVISPVTFSFVFSGEESGNLEECVFTLSRILEKDFIEKLNTLIKALEPIIMAVLGVVVGVMVLLVFIPIFEFMKYV